MIELSVQLASDLEFYKLMKIKPNFSELSRIYGPDRRTIQKHFDGYKPPIKNQNRSSMLDELQTMIKEKLLFPGITSKGIYEFLKEEKYIVGSESNFRKYVAKMKKELKPIKSTMRYETAPGKQAQVDWKENVQMISKHGEVFIINIFVYVLGYSRVKVYFITISKEQIEVFKSLVEAFKFTGGVPQTILFDNMSTVIDSMTKDYYKVNSKMKAFADDFGFKVKRCKARRPQTKGKVESSVRYASWLIPYNREFETVEELKEIMKSITIRVNQETSQATGMPPFLLLHKEKEHLQPLPNKAIMNQYLETIPARKVSHDSMISFNGNKYSVPVEYIGKSLQVEVINHILHIYYNHNLVRTHKILNKMMNYHEQDYKELVSRTFPDTDIESMAVKNLSIMDTLYREDESNE